MTNQQQEAEAFGGLEPRGHPVQCRQVPAPEFLQCHLEDVLRGELGVLEHERRYVIQVVEFEILELVDQLLRL